MEAGASIAFLSAEKKRVRSRVAARLGGCRPSPVSVGRYTLAERLGHGAAGVVYRAHDPRLKRDVALKLIHAPVPKQRETLLREAHTLAALSHPNVVQVFDAGTSDDAVFIAMEYVSGMSLEDWYSAEARTEAETVEVMLDAGRGLAAAHAAGIVHRDFKPSNVLVGTDGRARVADFGLACTSPTAEGSEGTPGYFAPEQLAGAAPSPLSDQYAFCVAFHEALTHRRPSGHRFARWWLSIAKPIISRGLQPDPSSRHPSVGHLVRRFERRRHLWVGAGMAGAASMGAGLTRLLF